jgi:hypothetical protein
VLGSDESSPELPQPAAASGVACTASAGFAAWRRYTWISIPGSAEWAADVSSNVREFIFIGVSYATPTASTAIDIDDRV